MLSFYSKIINLNSHLFDKLLENAAQRRRTLNSPGMYCDRRNVSPLGAKTRKKIARLPSNCNTGRWCLAHPAGIAAERVSRGSLTVARSRAAVSSQSREVAVA